MEFKAHTYQQYAIDYILSHQIAALFLDCGLGKTVITLTALWSLMLDSFDVKRCLIVAPLRVARDTWPSEIAKWGHLEGLTYEVATGDEKNRLKAVKNAMKGNARIVIVNRENLPWLIAKTPWIYDMVVLDELSSFKSSKALRFKALRKIRPQISRIVGLTGTPAPNGYMDLWAQFRLLDEGERLEKFITRYRQEYFTLDPFKKFADYELKPDSVKRINSKIADITVSMSAVEHLKMPELLKQQELVTMSSSETALYNRLKREKVLQLNGDLVTAKNAASLCGKLSQLANGAIYDEDGNVCEFHSRKLDALEDLIEEANGKPVLVAYWFKHDFERIKKRIPDVREIKTSGDIRDWNAGQIRVALIHPASAGHGLNLQQGGNFMIWFGLTWSLELYEQTNARLWRQGQKAKTVVIKHILTEGTIDRQIYEALLNKHVTQSTLMDAVRAQI